MKPAVQGNTQDVDILLRRRWILEVAGKRSFETVGFVRRHVAGIDVFSTTVPAAKARDAVHVVFAGEKVRPEYESAAPDVG